MSNDATNLIKLAARHGFLPADVARVLIDKVRGAADPDRLAEHLLVQGGHCTTVQIERLRNELTAIGETPPNTIAGFRIIDRLGVGGMGIVFRAQQISMQRVVALKLLSNELLKNDALGQRFLREARAAGKINHPHVVGCYDVGVANGRFYMALEYVSGGDAERLMRSYDNRIGELRALEIARDAARGLRALHEANFIHRDIKPSNILLTEEGVAKIGDLGLVSTTTPDQKLTQSGAALGTPAYMSPEQADGASDLDVRTDVYSLGATLFYLLTGHPPYTGQSAWAVVAKVINDPFPDPRRLTPEISAPCAELVLKATAKDRKNRFADANDMLHAIEALLSNRTNQPVANVSDRTSHSGVTQTSIIPPAKTKRPAWVIPSAVAAVALIIMLQVYLIMRPNSQSESPVLAATTSTTAEPPRETPASDPPNKNISQPESKPSIEKNNVVNAGSSPTPAVVSGETSPANVEKPKGWLDNNTGTGTPPPSSLVSAPTPSTTPLVQVPVGQDPGSPAVKTGTTAISTEIHPPAVHVPVESTAHPTATTQDEKPMPVVAVLGCEAGDVNVIDFAKAFPELLTVSLTRKGNFDLVERTQLRKVLNEQELTQSGAIDSANAARIGALIGARVLITQRVYTVGDFIYVSAKAIDVETGRVKAVSKGELQKNATPAVMSMQIAADLGRAIDALSGATKTDSQEIKDLLAKIVAATRGKKIPTIVIAVDEMHVNQSVPDPAVRTEFGYLLRKSGFRVIESDSPALAQWAKAYASGRTTPFPADLGAVDVVIAGSGSSQSVGSVGQLRSARARLEISAIAVTDGQVLAVERATTSGADASDILAGKLALEKGVRQLALSFVTDMTTAWNAR